MNKKLIDFINTSEDIPMYEWYFDFPTLISDVKDYLDISEKNIELLYRSELQSIMNREDLDDLPPGYITSLEDNAEHRFMVSLPLRIRYAAILGLVTAVEWSGEYFTQFTNEPFKKKPGGKNITIHQLETMCCRTRLDRSEEIKDLESLIWIRNCIAHNSGLEQNYEYKDDLPRATKRLKGFSLAEWHYLGRHIAIEKCALDPYIERMKHLVMDILKAAHEKELIKT